MSAVEAVVAVLVLAGLVVLWLGARPAYYDPIWWRYDGRAEHNGRCCFRDLETKRLCRRRRGHRGRHRAAEVMGPPTLAMLGAYRPEGDGTDGPEARSGA